METRLNNQMNIVLSMLQSIVHKVHSLSIVLNRKFVQQSVNLQTCSWVEGHYKCGERFNRPNLFGLANYRQQNLNMAVN